MTRTSRPPLLHLASTYRSDPGREITAVHVQARDGGLDLVRRARRDRHPRTAFLETVRDGIAKPARSADHQSRLAEESWDRTSKRRLGTHRSGYLLGQYVVLFQDFEVAPFCVVDMGAHQSDHGRDVSGLD